MGVDYEIRVCEFDGWEYQFPITRPQLFSGLSELEALCRRDIEDHSDWLDAIIPKELSEGYYGWEPTDNFILNMKPISIKEEFVGRFSYNPESYEFLPGRLSTSHAQSIHMHGSYLYNDYIRGIYIKEKDTVLIRPYYNPMNEQGQFDSSIEYDCDLDYQMTHCTVRMLVKNGMKSSTRVITKVNNNVVREYCTLFI